MRRVGRALAWLLRAVLGLLVGCAVLAVAAAAALFWLVSKGPVDLTWLARRAASHFGGPANPGLPAVGHVTLRWTAFDGGASRAVELDAGDVSLNGKGAAPAVSVAEARILLSPAALLRGEVAPRTITLRGLRLRLLRDRDGQVSLDDGAPDEGRAAPAGSLADTIDLLRRPASGDGSPGAGPFGAALSQLAAVTVQDAAVELRDQRLGTVLRLDGVAADLKRQPAGGVAGDATARLGIGGVETDLTLHAALGEAGTGTRLTAALAPVSPAALAHAVPGLAPLAPADTSVTASATLDLSPGLAPLAAALKAGAGAGRLVLPDAAVPFESLSLSATAAWSGADGWRRPDRLQVEGARAVLASPRGGWPTTLSASGTATDTGKGLQADVQLALDHVAVADVPALWPSAWGGHVRPWLVENLTAGILHDGHATATVQAAADGSGLRIAAAEGGLLGDDVTVHWLRPVPPAEGVQAVLTLLNPDVIQISIPTARQGAAALTNGQVRINGLSVKDQDLALSLDLSCTVPVLLELLKHPRLNLLSKHPVNVQRPAGALTGSLQVTLPLENHLEFEQVDIRAKGRLTRLRLGGLVAKRDLDRGDVTFEVSQDGLRAAGQATVAGIAGAVSVNMDFRAGGPADVVMQASLAGRATARQLATAGLDAGGLMGAGQAALKAAYAARRDGNATVDVQADLRDAALSIVGWTKAPGQPAHVNGQLSLLHDRLTGVRTLDAAGPGMEVRGRAEMVGDRPRHLVLDPIHLGPTHARGEIRLPGSPGEPIRATLDGTVLDLAPHLSGQSSSKPAPSRSGPRREEGGTPFVADVRFDKVLLAGERSIGGLTAHAEHDGRRLLRLAARSTGREQVSLGIAPRGTGRIVSLRTADAGSLLRALDITDDLNGGTLALEASYDDTRADPPLTGIVAMNDFHVRGVASVGKILQALTVYGIPDAISGPGLAFSQLTAPFRWEGGVLSLHDARAFSASLGITTEGRIDTRAKALNLDGTIVPAYIVNSALGRIPVLGRLFTAERGGGLVAVNYSYRGPLDKPSVSVNPLSALTPGFLRRLFKMFD